MFTHIHYKKSHIISRLVTLSLIFGLIFAYAIPMGSAQTFVFKGVAGVQLPPPGMMVTLSKGFTPALIKGITIHPENPLQFDFIVDKGDADLNADELKFEAKKLVKYFMASLTVPEDEMWVNLSPYEEDRIAPEGFGQTEMGRDLLTQDYLLKQLTASMIYPEKELGKKFWDRVLQEAKEKYDINEIPVSTFTRVWIVPQTATIFEHQNSAFVLDSKLRVMLEEDYIALQNNIGNAKFGMDVEHPNAHPMNETTSEIAREILLPAIEKEINEGRTFAQVRQIYNSMILATWYKMNLQKSLLGQVYVDQNKILGIDVEDKNIKQKIYNQYLEALDTGVYSYVKEEYDADINDFVPRKYFSGGVTLANWVTGFGQTATGSSIRKLIEASSTKSKEALEIVTRMLNRTGVFLVTVIFEEPGEQSSELALYQAQHLVPVVSSPISEFAQQLIQTRQDGLDLLRSIQSGNSFSGEGKRVLHVVIGNDASDLDSMASSLAFSTAMNQDPDLSSEVLYVPVMNIPTEEFHLKMGAPELFNQLGITQNDLLFDEDDISLIDLAQSIDEIKSRGYDVQVTLMDHNKLAEHQRGISSLVVGIFDHHENDLEWEHYENLTSNSVQIEGGSEGVGSNATLIAKHIFGLGVIPSIDLAQILIWPILKDTINFTDTTRFNATDVEIYDRLAEIVNRDQGEVYQEILDAQEETKSKWGTISDHLLSDYKIFSSGFADGAQNSFVIAATNGLALEDLVGQDLIESVYKFAVSLNKRRGLSPRELAFVTTFNLNDGNVERGLIIYSTDQSLRDRLVAFLSNDIDRGFPIDLQSVQTMGPISSFKISPKISRKKLVPVLQEFFGGITTTSSPIVPINIPGASALVLGNPDPSILRDRSSVAVKEDDSAPIIDESDAVEAQSDTESNPTSSPLQQSLRPDSFGGIDFDPQMLDLQIKRDGRGFPLPLPMQDIENINIDGLLPVIINIIPIINVPIHFGFNAPIEPLTDLSFAVSRLN